MAFAVQYCIALFYVSTGGRVLYESSPQYCYELTIVLEHVAQNFA